MDNKKPLRRVRFKVEKSDLPDETGTHILVMETATEHGWGYRRIFKGSKEECLKKKKEMEEANGK